jgi:serine/tyrosine/threonine adenylyltransferase
MLRFDNRFLSELPGDPQTTNATRQVLGACWSRVAPTRVRAPRLIAHSREMAAELGLPLNTLQSSPWLDALAGNGTVEGMDPYATCYGGHQFGHWAGQLGDGRAILLGEVVTRAGTRWELQLKGAGPTPYSRRADGRAVLRSSVREFLLSEAMHHLGVPTTRALSLVTTGDDVVRDMFYDGHPKAEPGAIVCRVAPSFTRFGHFEILAARGDMALLQRLVDFTIDRDFSGCRFSAENRIADWLAEIARRTGRMVAQWMGMGFVHGVMNTDNMSILGLTIDYGPYGWVDNFDPGWTPNTTDAQGKRYAFGRQPAIARWNLERLADALGTLYADPQSAGDALEPALDVFDETYNTEIAKLYARKFGFDALEASDSEFIGRLFDIMTRAEIDMTIFFRTLAEVTPANPSAAPLMRAFYRSDPRSDLRDDLSDDLRGEHGDAFEAWVRDYAQRLTRNRMDADARVAMMNAANPRYVLRNYLAQQAIDKAEAGDASMIDSLLEVLRQPFTDQPGRDAFAEKRPEWARHKAGCSMLSCSS